MREGTRVEIPAHTDTWMRGDRYGEVVKVKRGGRIDVKLDRSGRTRTFNADECSSV